MLSSSDELYPRVMTLRIKATPNVSDLVQFHAHYGSRFNTIHTAAYWNHLGKLGRQSVGARRWLHENPQALKPARDEVLASLKADQHGSRDIANIAWGLAAARVGSKFPWSALWRQLEASMLPLLEAEPEDLSPQSIANTLWAFAHAGVPSRLFDSSVTAISGHAEVFSPR